MNNNNEQVNANEVYEQWSPIIETATGIEDRNKLKWMSEYAFYHDRAERKEQVTFMNESVYNTMNLNPGMNLPGMGSVNPGGAPGTTTGFYGQGYGSGDKPQSLLPLSIQVAGRTVGLDLVPVVNLGGPWGVLSYMDFPYAGGALKHNSASNNGLGGADGEQAPVFVKSDVTWSSAPAEGDVLYTVGGDGASSESVTDIPFKLIFVRNDRISGEPIFAVYTAKDQTVTDPSNTTYVKGVQGDTTLADVFKSGSSYYISTDGTIGNNIIENDEYITTKAEEVYALQNHIPGFTGRGNINDSWNSSEPYLREEGESTPDNLIGLRLRHKNVSAGTVQVAAGVTREQVQDLKQYGIDAISQVESVLINELTQTINKHILDRIFRLGNTNAEQINNVDGTNLSLYINSSSGTTNITLGLPADSNNNADTVTLSTSAYVPTSGDDQGSLQRIVYTRVLAAANIIQTRGRIGSGNFAVTNGKIGTAIQSVSGFTPYPMSNTVNQNSGSLYPIGSIAGVTVYIDPQMDWNDDRVAVGYKGDGNTPGLIFMPYLMAESVETIAEGTMGPKLSVKSRYSLVEAGHHPQIQYYTLGIDFGDKQII